MTESFLLITTSIYSLNDKFYIYIWVKVNAFFVFLTKNKIKQKPMKCADRSRYMRIQYTHSEIFCITERVELSEFS